MTPLYEPSRQNSEDESNVSFCCRGYRQRSRGGVTEVRDGRTGAGRADRRGSGSGAISPQEFGMRMKGLLTRIQRARLKRDIELRYDYGK